MNFIAIIISIALSLFSTIVMSYVSLATPIGPWIAPTLVFIALLVSQIIVRITTTSMAHVVAAGSIGSPGQPEVPYSAGAPADPYYFNR